jgi:hypothetical protein
VIYISFPEGEVSGDAAMTSGWIRMNDKALEDMTEVEIVQGDIPVSQTVNKWIFLSIQVVTESVGGVLGTTTRFKLDSVQIGERWEPESIFFEGDDVLHFFGSPDFEGFIGSFFYNPYGNDSALRQQNPFCASCFNCPITEEFSNCLEACAGSSSLT